MSKDIKDYLHLYLGCEVSVTNLEGRYTRLITHEFFNTFYDEDEGKFYNDPKPILRPLSDMTEEERESQEMVYMRMQEMQDEEGHICDAEIWAETTRWACAKGFDMFQLIEAGLAIDKTTLTVNQ